MAEIVQLKATSPTEDMRQRFEAFIRRGCRADEASAFLARSRGGEYVMATTMGSGTTGVACELECRKFIGIELQEDYFQMATARLEMFHACAAQ